MRLQNKQFIDQDYRGKLNNEEKEWLNSFNNYYYSPSSKAKSLEFLEKYDASDLSYKDEAEFVDSFKKRNSRHNIYNQVECPYFRFHLRNIYQTLSKEDKMYYKRLLDVRKRFQEQRNRLNDLYNFGFLSHLYCEDGKLEDKISSTTLKKAYDKNTEFKHVSEVLETINKI